MSRFSKQARALARGLTFTEKTAEIQENPIRASMKEHQEEVARAPKLLDKVPLDRRRGVPLEGMTDEDLARARTQAEKRVERTSPSADRSRYELQLASINAAQNRRTSKSSASRTDVIPPPAERMPIPDFEEEDEAAATKPRALRRRPDLESDDLPDELHGRPDPSAFGIDFAPHPNDTPGTD